MCVAGVPERRQPHCNHWLRTVLPLVIIRAVCELIMLKFKPENGDLGSIPALDAGDVGPSYRVHINFNLA